MRGRHNLPAPTLGVSTLAARNQPEGMMVEQINMRSDPVRKLSRRPAMEYIGQVSNTLWKAYHTFTRNDVEYELGVTDTNEVQVVRDGVITTTNQQTQAVSDYLSGATADDIRIHTIADTSFIVNTTVVVEETTEVVPRVEYAYLNTLSALNYGEEIVVILQWEDEVGTSYNYRGLSLGEYKSVEVKLLIPNADGGDYEVADKARATYAVAKSLASKINNLSLFSVDTVTGDVATVSGSSVCSATSIGSVVSISTSTLKNLTVKVDGGQGEDAIVPINYTNQDTEGLPKYAVEGTIVEIQPGLDSESSKGAYYLVATATDNLDPADVNEVMTEVYWKETANPEEPNRLLGASMPIVVVQEAVPVVSNDDTLWAKKPSGNVDSNPMPTFVGRAISALGTFQGRLVIGAGDDVVLSNTDDIYQFFRKSVLQLLATDTVGLGASSTDVDSITGFGIHDKDLIINFSKKQFKVSGGQAVTPQTTAMTPATAYATSARPEPLALAGSLLLPFSYGDSGGVWDYRQKEQNEQNTAVAVTRMVEGYLSGDIDLWAASSALDMAVVKCIGSNTLYVYEQTTLNEQRTQMAWSKWELRLEGEILWLGFNNNSLNIITLTNGVTEKRRVDMSTRTPDAPDSIHLDDMVKVTIPLGTDTGTLPDNFPDHQDLVYVQTSDCKSPYYTAIATRVGNTITVSTNVHNDTDATLYVGRPYTSEFTPTRQFIREEGVVVDIDRLSIKNLLLDVVHTTELTMDTISEYYDTAPVTILADRVGAMKLGVKSFYSGDFNFPVRKQAKWASQRFYTNGYLPLNVIGITWQGLYKQRMERF